MMDESGRPRRLLIAEDHRLLADGLAHALCEQGHQVEVVVPAASSSPSAVVIASIQDSLPELVLLDLDLGEGAEAGMGTVAAVTALGVRVLVLTGTQDSGVHGACLEAGAVGVASKQERFDQVLARVAQVFAGGSPLSAREEVDLREAARARRRRRREELAPFQGLTHREQQVLSGLMEGHRVAAIASQSGVAESTVRSQVRSILGKLNARSQLEAIARARQVGWRPSSPWGGALLGARHHQD